MRPSPAPTSRRTAPSPSLRRWLRTPSRTSRSLSRYSFAYLGSPPNRLSSSQRVHRSCSTMLRFSPSVLTREPCHLVRSSASVSRRALDLTVKRGALPERADAADQTCIVELEHVNAAERH